MPELKVGDSVVILSDGRQLYNYKLFIHREKVIRVTKTLAYTEKCKLKKEYNDKNGRLRFYGKSYYSAIVVLDDNQDFIDEQVEHVRVEIKKVKTQKLLMKNRELLDDEVFKSYDMQLLINDILTRTKGGGITKVVGLAGLTPCWQE